jgi:hypothetical protein
MQQDAPETVPYVEFVYRVYEDGRRERFATVLVPVADGGLRPVYRPTGRLGRFAREAVAGWRCVTIDVGAHSRMRHRPP